MNNQINDTASPTMTCLQCGTESPFVAGQTSCPQCRSTWYPNSTGMTCCRNCGGDFSHAQSPLCPSCGLHLQDMVCRGCGESYRMTYPERSAYPCHECGWENLKREFLIKDMPTLFEETEYATPGAPTAYPFDERTSPYLVKMLPSTNDPLVREMPFTKRENKVNLSQYLLDKIDKNYRLDAVSLVCDTSELPLDAEIRLTLRDRRSSKVITQKIVSERKKREKCIFLFELGAIFYSGDLTFTLEVEKGGKSYPMNVPVERAYSSSWIQWRDASGCLFTPALTIYGDYYNRDTGECVCLSDDFPYDSVDVTNYPDVSSDYPVEDRSVLLELTPDYSREHISVSDSFGQDCQVNLKGWIPTGYETFLTGISFVCDTLQMPEDVVMRLQAEATWFPHLDVSIIPLRNKNAVCRFNFEPQKMYDNFFEVNLTFEWGGHVASETIHLLPSLCNTTLARWMTREGWHYSPAMTLYGYVQNPKTGERFTNLPDYPLFAPEFPEDNPTTDYPTTDYPTTDYPTTDYPTTDYPTTAYPQGHAFMREASNVTRPGIFTRGISGAGMNSLGNIPMNASEETWEPTTDYPTTAYPSGEDDPKRAFSNLDLPVTEVTCYNTGDPEHGILNFEFKFGPEVKTHPARSTGSMSLTSPTLDSKFSSPSGLRYKQSSLRHIAGFNSPTGQLKDARQVCVVTEEGFPRFTDFTNDPTGERTDRSQTIPEFLKKVTVASEDGSGLPVGEDCFEETLEDGTVLRYSMETGAVAAVRESNGDWRTAEEMKNDLRIIYENKGGGYTETPGMAMKDDIRQASPDTSGTIRQVWSRRDGLADIVTLSDTSYRISWYAPEQVTGFNAGNGLFGIVPGAVPLKSWTFEATLISIYQDEAGRMYDQDTGRLLTEEDLSYLKSMRITEQRGSLRFVQEWEQVNLTTMMYTKGEGAERETMVTTTTATDPVSQEELARGNDFLDSSFLKVGSVYTHELEMCTTMKGIPGGYRTRHRRYPFGDVCLLEEKGSGTPTKESVVYEYELNSASRNYGCCIRETWSNGKIVEYEYDRKKRLISRKEPWGARDSQITRYTYCNVGENDQRIASEIKNIFDGDGEKFMSGTQYSYGETPALKWQKISKLRRGGPVSSEDILYGYDSYSGDARPEITLTEWYGKDSSQNGASSPCASGRLKRIVGSDGVELMYTYEAGTEPGITCVGTMTQMADGAIVPGLSTRKVSFYDSWGKVVREREYVHTGDGFTMTDEKNYTYDSSRRVSRTDYANGRHTESSWICVGPLLETDEHGRKTRYEYNSAKRLKREIQEVLPYMPGQGEPVGMTPAPEKVTEYIYDGAGRQIKEIIIQGQKRTQTLSELDALGRTVKLTEADGTIKLYSYSADGLETTVVNPTGAVYTWRDNPDGSQASETGTGLQPRYYSQYMTDFGIRSNVWVDSPYGALAETKEVDGLGRVLMEGTAKGSGVTETKIRYTEKGRPDLRRGDGLPTVWMEYDSLGNLTYESVDFRMGGSSRREVYTKVSYIYGVLPVSMTSLPAWMAIPLVWKKTERRDYYGDGNPSITTWELVSRTRPEADHAVVTRDRKGRDTMTWQCTVDGKSYEYSLDSESDKCDRTISLNGRTLFVEKNGQGALTYDYAFVSGGERCVMKDVRGNASTRVTDLMNRTLSETDAQGNTVTRQYDPVTGLLKKIINPLGKTTEYEYDGQGNLVAQFGTAVQPMCFEYDRAGRLLSLRTFRVPGEVLTTSPRNRTDGDVTRWTYHAASGVVLSKTMPDGKTTYYSYDARGLMTGMSFPGGKRRELHYARLSGLLTSIRFDDETPPVKVMYDEEGRIMGIEDASGYHEFEYDESKDMKREFIYGQRSCQISYDWGKGGRAAGYNLKIGSNAAQQVVYGYGRDRKLHSITLDGDWAYQYTWNTETGLPEKITWPDGVSREMTYEAQRNLVKSLAYRNADGVSILALEKAFDPMARLMTESNSVTGEGLRQCNYNDRGEVISDTREQGDAWAYSYDNIGNRKTWAHAGEEEKSYLTNLLNQYTSVMAGYGSAQEVFTPAYDEMGNQTFVRTETGDWQITWNSEDRPVCFTRGNERVECVYDYMGRRVRKTLYRDDTPVSRRVFIYNGYQLVAELNDLEDSDEKALSKTWLWDPTGVFENSPLEMRVWNESGEEGYPELPSSSSEGTTEYPETGYPVSAFPEGHFFKSADLLMKDRDKWTATTTTYEDHLVLSLDKELFTQGEVCLDRIELALDQDYPPMKLQKIRAIVHLRKQVTVYGKWKGEILHLDLTSSAMSEDRLAPESGEVRIDFQKWKQNTAGSEWEPVEGMAYEGDNTSVPLAHVSGARVKRRESSSEYATTGYPTTDYPSSSSSESSSETPSSVSEDATNSLQSFVPGSKTRSLYPPSRLGTGRSVVSTTGDDSKRYYYLNDGKRNVVALRTPEDGLCVTYTYGTYGQCLKVTGNCVEVNPFRYSSEYYDRELGMVYYNYRHYNPMDGRWLSRDPMEESGGMNLYGFCSNNPVSRVDNLGLSELPGASPTGFSNHWGNIVREKKSWAVVCYKYYKGAKELGGNSGQDIWENLAKANKLSHKDIEKWVKGYTPLPEPGDLFLVPNTFVIYTTKSDGMDDSWAHPLKTAKEEKITVIKSRFDTAGVRIVEQLEKEDRQLFLELWKTDGIFGFCFIGHGSSYDDKLLGMVPIKTHWVGFCPTSEKVNYVKPTDVDPPYKLAFIAAFSCGALDVGWGNVGERYPLSELGEYVSYQGRFDPSDDNWGFWVLKKSLTKPGPLFYFDLWKALN